jgi:hypothetical protein
MSMDRKWVLLAVVYAQVFAAGRTPEAAKREILIELRTGRLPHRVKRTIEYLPRPAPDPTVYVRRPPPGGPPERQRKLEQGEQWAPEIGDRHLLRCRRC